MERYQFRAWDKKRKRMYKVLHLHFNEFEGNWATVEGYDVIEQKHVNIQIQPKNITIMQYTGLKDDIKEQEIYENDIVEMESLHEPMEIIFKGRVRMSDGCWVVVRGDECMYLYDENYEVKKLGNIFESKEFANWEID